MLFECFRIWESCFVKTAGGGGGCRFKLESLGNVKNNVFVTKMFLTM